MSPTVIRPPADADVPNLVALMIAADEVDVGAPDSDEEDVLYRWRAPGFDRDRDAFVVTVDDEIVGYAVAFDKSLEQWVHPRVRTTGIEELLIEVLERRSLEQAPGAEVEVFYNITNKEADLKRILEQRGYRMSHFYARLEMDLVERSTEAERPEGVTIRTYEAARDERPLYDAYLSAWRGNEGTDEELETFESWKAEHGGTDFHADLCFLAERDGRIVGFNVCLLYEDVGWIQRIATVPEERGRGVARALLFKSFDALYERGISRVGLTVSSRNVTGARRIYEALGMTERLRYENFRKVLTTQSP